jgi:hypothetical protein
MENASIYRAFFYFYEMINTSFFDKIAQVLIENYSDNLSDTIVVLPNKRAKIFLIEALKNKSMVIFFLRNY